MFIRLAPVVFLAIVSLALTGCAAKLNESRSYTLQPELGEGFFLSAQQKPQKITVEFTADGEVTVLLFKADDAKSDEAALMTDEKKALGFKTGKSGSFTADVPENTQTRLVIRGASKTTKVDVKVTN